MSVSDADIAYMCELFAPLGDISQRRMMGGLTLYHAGQVFAMLDGDGSPYLKARGGFAAELEAAGARQFIFTDKSGRSSTMGYWSLPDAALDDPELACDWARRCLAALS